MCLSSVMLCNNSSVDILRIMQGLSLIYSLLAASIVFLVVWG